MADQQFRSLEGAKTDAAAKKTALAASVLHLFKSGFIPNGSTPLADYTAQECDYDGYAAKTIATWGDPVLSPGSGYLIYAPQQTFTWALDADAVGNIVGGTYLVTAGGKLMDVVIFETPVPLQGVDQALVVTPIEVFPTQ